MRNATAIKRLPLRPSTLGTYLASCGGIGGVALLLDFPAQAGFCGGVVERWFESQRCEHVNFFCLHSIKQSLTDAGSFPAKENAGRGSGLESSLPLRSKRMIWWVSQVKRIGLCKAAPGPFRNI